MKKKFWHEEWEGDADRGEERGKIAKKRKDVILNMYIKYIVSSMLQPQAYLWLNPFQNEI